MTKPNPYYKRFKLWPGTGKLRPVEEPHGSFLTTYVNDIALRSIKTTEGMTHVACIINEEYNADKKLATLSVMYKVANYNPGGGDWFWAKYDANNGYVLESGKLGSCISCYNAKKNNDCLYPREERKSGRCCCVRL